jgi:hypothetical protein
MANYGGAPRGQKIERMKEPGRLKVEGIGGEVGNLGPSLDKVAAALSGVAGDLGNWADAAAKVEGKRAAELAVGDGSFAPRHDNTVYGTTFDETGRKALVDRTEVAARRLLMDATLAHRDDPAGLNAATQKIVREASAEIRRTMPEAAGDVETSLTRLKDTYQFGANREYVEKQDKDARETRTISYMGATDDLRRMAITGAGDPATMARVEAERKRLHARIDADEDLGEMQRFRLKGDIDGLVLHDGVGALVDKIARPEDLAAKRQAFVDAYTSKTGDIGRMTTDQYQAGLKAFDRRGAALEKVQKTRASEAETAVDEIETRAMAGEAIEPARWSAAKVKVQIDDPSGAAAKRMDVIAGVQAWGTTFRSLNIGDQRATVAGLDAKAVREGLTPQEETRRKVARTILGQTESDEKVDPLGAKRKLGFEIGALDWSSPNASGQLASRVVQAEKIAKDTGGAVTYLERADLDRLKQTMNADPKSALAIGQTIMAGAGAKAPRLLKEVSTDMPSLAYVLRPGNPVLAQDWARAAEAEQAGVESAKPGQADLIGIMKDRKWSDLFVGRDSEMAQMANAAAGVIGARLGPGVAKFDTNDSGHKRIAEEVLGDMLGRKKDARGFEIGGPVKVNGMTTVAPSLMRTENFNRILYLMNDADLSEAGIKPMAGGKPLNVSDVSGAKWVPSGKDRYRLALGDPRTGAAQFIQNAEGGDLVVDLSPASPLMNRWRARAPSLFR